MKHVTISIAAVLAVVAGCNSTPEDQIPPVIVHTPLELDPTHEVAVVGWWSDGLRLLHVAEDGGYERFDSLNQYHAPAERGRWSHDSYAVLWLEPYDTPRPERIRVSIRRIDDRLALETPRRGPMFPIEQPPPVLEDRLFGRWESALGVLQLESDLDYSFSPRADAVDGMIGAVGHRGRWSVDDRAIALSPEPEGVAAHWLQIVTDGKQWRLVSPEAAYRRAGR